MKSLIMNPHKISAHSDNKQKSYGMLLIELVTWGVTNQDVLLLPTIRKAKMTVKTHAIEFFRFQFNLSVREDFEPP